MRDGGTIDAHVRERPSIPRARPTGSMRNARYASFLFLALIMAGCATAGSGRASRGTGPGCAFRVCVQAVPGSSTIVYRAYNGAEIPAQVGIYFSRLQNLLSSGPDTVIRVIPPGERWVLTRLRVEDPEEDIGVRPVVTIDLGSDSIEHRPPRPYALPFGGDAPRPLISGYGGPTHLGANRHSFDFGMPEGTPILAAREGIVVYVQDGFTRGGLSSDLIERANLVAVGHEDGTIASYGHLRRGVPVSVGDTVRRGEIVGWSGATGFAGQPHLHFHVGKRLMGGDHRTIPIVFESGDDEGQELVVGELYGPGVEWAEP